MAHFLNTSSNQVHSRVLREHSSSSVPQATIYSTPLCHLSLSLVWHGWHFGYLQHQLSHESHSFLYASSLRLDSWALWNPPHQRYWHNAILQSLGQVPFQKTPSQPPLFFAGVLHCCLGHLDGYVSCVHHCCNVGDSFCHLDVSERGTKRSFGEFFVPMLTFFFRQMNMLWLGWLIDWNDLMTGNSC